MGVQHVAGLIAAVHDVVDFLLLIVEVIGVEVVIGGISLLAGRIGVQHRAGRSLDVIAAAVLSGEALRLSIQRSGGHNTVGRYGHIGDAALDLGVLALLHIAVGRGRPDVQGLGLQRHVGQLDGKGLFVAGVVDEHHGEVLLVGCCQRHIAGVSVNACGGMLVRAGTEGRKGSARQHAPDTGGVACIFPAGLGKLGDMAQHVKHRVIVDITTPRVAGGEQLLMAVLDAFVEGTDSRLEHVHRPAGANKGVGEAVQQRQRALVAADGADTVLGGLVLLQLGIAEGRAALAVPDLLVIHIGHLDIVIGGIGAVVEADGIHRVIQVLVITHQGYDLQTLVLIRGHDLDAAVGLLGLLGKIFREIRLVGNGVGEIFDDPAVRIAGLVRVGVDVIHDIAVLLVGVKDGLLVPFVVGGVPVCAFVSVDPVRAAPAQNRHLDIRVDRLGIGGHNKAGRAGGIRLLVLIPHGAGLGTGGVVAVVAHLHLDVAEQRVVTAEQIVHHGPVGVRAFGLVVKQQVAGGVAVQHAEPLIGPAVDILGGLLDLRTSDGDNAVHRDSRIGRRLAGGSLGLGGLGIRRTGHDQLVIQAGAHKAGAEGGAHGAHDA